MDNPLCQYDAFVKGSEEYSETAILQYVIVTYSYDSWLQNFEVNTLSSLDRTFLT